MALSIARAPLQVVSARSQRRQQRQQTVTRTRTAKAASAARSRRCGPSMVAAQSTETNTKATEGYGDFGSFQMPGSDVNITRLRAYWTRPWLKKDVLYAIFIGGLHAACLLAPFTFSWDALAVSFGLYVVTGMLGITLSYHRNLSHRSFKLPKWLEYTFAYCGAQAVQGDPIEWVSAHRYHHQFCDTPKDPHTPREGFWHSHTGWLLDSKITDERAGMRKNCRDMTDQPFYRWLEKTYIWHIAASAVALYLWGGLPYVVWGLAVRTVWVYHVTWAVNSICHVWGNQQFNAGDVSKNNWLIGILAFGEGWHNNHHAFEFSARHGLSWWQFDPTWYTVKALELLGLAKNVQLPSDAQKAKLAF